MDAPTRDEIRSLCTEQSFERGITYYNQDRILELAVDGREVTATVRGSSDYQVSAVIEDDTIRTSCSCPYDYAGDCKHIVAVLLAVEYQGADLGTGKSGAPVSHSAPDVETLVEQTTAEELRTFLLEILEDNREIRDRFLAFSGADVGKTLYDYKREIDRLFNDAAGRHGMINYDTRISFSKYHDLAETRRNQEDVETATTIYRALAETIRENLDRIDDSSGHYGRELERAVAGYAETLVEADLDHEQKRPHIEYLFEEFVEADYGFASDYYDDALRTLCTTKDDLRYWLDRLDNHVSGVDIDPATIETKSKSHADEPQAAPETDSQDSTDEKYQSDEPSVAGQERTDDVLFASDFTDGPLTTDDFTGGVLDVEHLAVGPLKIEYFVGNAFDEFRIDDPTTVEEHTVDIDRGGSDSTDTEIVTSLRTRRVLSTYIYLLEELDEQEALTALYDDIYLESSTFCKQYAQRLIDNGDEQHALEVLEDGIRTFRSPKALRQLAADLYRGMDREAYRRTLKRLFVEHSEWAAYDELKEACDESEWEEIYQEFENRFTGDNQQRLIAMYVHEGQFQKAFTELQDSDDLSLVRRYRDPVATADPGAYFELYKELLVPFAAGETGRRHYREIAGHLEEMQGLVPEERFEEFVDFLKEKHSNRPAFLDELEKAGF